MKVGTLSVVAGTQACNAACPYCVSRMTPDHDLGRAARPINLRNFRKACCFARDCGVTTALITGKGEPSLFPDEITLYTSELSRCGFPFIELQTNAILLSENATHEAYLKRWYDSGLTTVCISVVHHDPARNAKLIRPKKKPHDFWRAVEKLHQIGVSVRLTCMMVKGYIDAIEPLRDFVGIAHERGVEQLTFRPIETPERSENEHVAKWTRAHRPTEAQLREVNDYFADHAHATPLLELPHGAMVYDCDGQNVCLTTCLTSSTNPENQRQLIFFPDGHLYYDWKYRGAVIM